MRFLDLYISGFGKFHDTAVSFEDGLNVIYGKNEAGKSTIHTFIRGMLFGIERQRGRAARNDIYSKYEPWENSGTYEGQLRLESDDGTIYRIERSFQKNKKEFTVINETTGREEPDGRAVLQEILGGMSETMYNNTISISQLKSATDEGMVSELKNYIANMNTSGNMALNITKATAYLKNQRKQFESQLSPEASVNYTSLLSEIRALERELSSPKYENQLQEYSKLRDSVRNELEHQKIEKEDLSDRLQKSRQVLDEFSFTDEASIEAYRNQAETLYQDYQHAQVSSSSKGSRFFQVFFFVTAAICAICAAYCGYLAFFPLPSPWLGAGPTALIFGVAALVLLMLGICVTRHRSRRRQEAEKSASVLSEILRRHLGESEISDESMKLLSQRLDRFITLCHAVTNSEDSLVKRSEQISALMAKQNDCSLVIEEQQRVQWELEKKLEHLSACKDRAAALKHILNENERIHQEIASVDLALDTLKELSTTIRDSFGLYLNKTASDLIAGITGGIYSSISIDENLNAFLNTRRKLIPLEQVSSGTADQIYLALRLAAAHFIQGDADRLPLIFDDSFVLYDDERLRTVLKWLPTAYSGQILVFTCHEREMRVLKEEGAAVHEVRL
ncbi:ATP-binding protein [Clostridium fessum]|jgi:uncharacterized protein YhaN|uniref:ATP-binding protein n=1 Tax=Clostridium fessum TaxID=2126740 RepID=UPI0022E80A7D|nr:AAA family ATPase [Clostridium fessum]